jgi:fructosamine-3-kinase
MTLWPSISEQISATTGTPFSCNERRTVSGGCINAAYVVSDKTRRFFVKLNDATKSGMFEAEAQGLREIAATQVIRVPQPICWGTAEDASYLVLEFIEMGRGNAAEELGRQLAALHRASASRFGWRINNTIGATPQVNTWSDSWTAFWREQRLGFQLQLAARNGAHSCLLNLGERLQGKLDALLQGHVPQPSLLHGDLWSGNWGCDTQGAPVIFDPAVYYGDRETDLAMTELFGGFGPRFYAAYREAYPLDPGYEVRKTLYNLYHALNHFNLFGGGYAAQAEQMMQRLLSEAG